MKNIAEEIKSYNQVHVNEHRASFDFLSQRLEKSDIDIESVVDKIQSFQVAIPSWALGTGGTRFGRFPGGGEPRSLEEKIDDVGLIHRLSGSAGAISLHIPWDIPKDAGTIRERADSHGIVFDAVNSNTFQDQTNQRLSYKYGSLCHADPKVRQAAIMHNQEVIDHGIALGSKSITVWLADGASFPGQSNFRMALDRTMHSLQAIHDYLPNDWKMFIEYKPYEPQFYTTVIQDWGTSFLLANACGEKAYTLVDLGHHLPNTNIEQIVSTLIWKGKLGGFHFNDSKYGDDDLTVGSIKPYQLFLIFNELIFGMENNYANNPALAWMIDASHNLKDPLEDLLQSLEAILVSYAKALLIDQNLLEAAQNNNDPVLAQEILQNAYLCDVRPLLREARFRSESALDPLILFRDLKIREQLIKDRGKKTMATGL